MSRTARPPYSRLAAQAAALMVGGALLAACSSGTAGAPAAKSATSSPSPTASSTETTPRPAPTATAPAADRMQATFILRANDQHYLDLLSEGQRLVGTPAFAAWRTKALADTTNTSAFTTADSHFTPDNEPTALTKWREDNGNAVAAIWQYASGATGPTETADDRANATKAIADLAAADLDAHAITAG